MASETKKQYEISFLLKGEGSSETVADLLKKSGMEIVSEGRINEIKLAYPIAKESSARFGCVVFSAFPEDIDELGKKMFFVKEVLRFLVITPPIAKNVRRSFGEGTGQIVETEVPPLEEILSAGKANEPEPASDSGEVNDVELDKKLEEILS